MFAVTGYALSSALALTAALRQFYPATGRLLREIAIIHLPFLWSIGAIKAAGTLTRLALGRGLHGWPGDLLRMAVFLLLCLPILWYGNRETGVLSRLRRLLTKRPRPAQEA